MKITFNGQAQEVRDAIDVATLLSEMSIEPRGVAVALNGEVVPRDRWEATKVDEGSVVEVVRAVQGG